MTRVLKREAAKRDLIAQWVWYASIGKMPSPIQLRVPTMKVMKR